MTQKTSKKTKSTDSSLSDSAFTFSNTAAKSLYNPDALQTLFKPLKDAGATLGLEQFKSQFEKFGPKAFQTIEEAKATNRANVEAVVKSSQILAKAAEELGKAISTFTQSSLELNAQAGQAMLGAKSLQDFLHVQSELAHNSMDHFISGSSKISDVAVKVANEVIEPIQTRVNSTIEKFTTKTAA